MRSATVDLHRHTSLVWADAHDHKESRIDGLRDNDDIAILHCEALTLGIDTVVQVLEKELV